MVRFKFLVALVGALSLVLVGCSKVEFAKIDDQTAIDGGKNSGADACLRSPAECLTAGASPTPAPHIVNQQVIVKAPPNAVDVIVVADNSGSMTEERAEFGTRLDNFIAQLADLDWRLCVITTDATNEHGALRQFGASGLYALSKDTPAYQDLFLQTMTHLATGSGDEQGIKSSYLAVQAKDPRCIRENASLAMVVLSDEDERSTGGRIEYINDSQYRPLTYENMPENLVTEVASSLGSEKIFSFHSLVIRTDDLACYDEQAQTHEAFTGSRYEEASRLTGGVIGNICSTDYGTELGKFANGVRRDLNSITLQCEPTVGTLSLNVTSVPSGFSYSYDLSGNKIHFTPSLPVGAVVDLKYTCPH